MRTTRHLLVAAIGAAMLLTSTAVAATAQSTTIKDKRADVVYYDSFDDDSGTTLDKADSTASGVDVTSMKVKHGKKSVVVTVKFSQLSKQTLVTAYVRVNGKSRPSYSLFTTSKKKGVVTDASGDEQKCTFPVVTKYGKNGSIKATVKRTCLGKPKKIKLQAGAVNFDDSDSESFSLYADAVSAKKIEQPQWTRWLKAS